MLRRFKNKAPEDGAGPPRSAEAEAADELRRVAEALGASVPSGQWTAGPDAAPAQSARPVAAEPAAEDPFAVEPVAVDLRDAEPESAPEDTPASEEPDGDQEEMAGSATSSAPAPARKARPATPRSAGSGRAPAATAGRRVRKAPPGTEAGAGRSRAGGGTARRSASS